jgi:hypothetical protein
MRGSWMRYAPGRTAAAWTLVDGIRTLDRQRELVVTWVHLAPPANKALAKAIAAGIVGTREPAARASCREPGGRSRPRSPTTRPDPGVRPEGGRRLCRPRTDAARVPLHAFSLRVPIRLRTES